MFFLLFAPLVVEKSLPMSLILRDQEVAELFVKEKAERVATHALFRILVAQMQSVVPDVIHKGKLPDDVRVAALQNRDERIVLVDGVLFIANAVTKQVQRVFPRIWSVTSSIISSHQIDRGSTGVSLVGFAQSLGLLWCTHFGCFQLSYYIDCNRQMHP